MRKSLYIFIMALLFLSACTPSPWGMRDSSGHHHERPYEDESFHPRESRGGQGHHRESPRRNEGGPNHHESPRMNERGPHHRGMMGHHRGMHGMYAPLEDSTGENEIAIPPLLESDRVDGKDIYYTVEAMEGETEFFEGIRTKTRGYNSSFLGPVIRIKKDQRAHITLKNNLTEDTTVHWHGLLIEGDNDGGPHDVIPKGEKKEISFDIKQDQATLWFHPHPKGHTARQVYEGLAGLLYIEDDDNPFEYGVNDIPLVLQDRMFTEDGQLNYRYAYHPNGVTGNIPLVNGTVNPKLTVPKGKVRLRLLNGSNTRDYSLTFSHNQTFEQIATDGGFLDEPIEMERINLTTAERAEIIVDFSMVEAGDTIDLVTDDGTVILPIVISNETMTVKKQDNLIRDPLYTITDKEMEKEVSKEIILSGMGPHVSINGKKFDSDRIDLTQKVGETEIWEVYNRPNMMGTVHPFHIHGTQFKIVSLNGKKPPKELQGYKDTIHLEPGDRAELAVKFVTPGVYMYHCHILEHEDNGMMGQVLVE